MVFACFRQGLLVTDIDYQIIGNIYKIGSYMRQYFDFRYPIQLNLMSDIWIILRKKINLNEKLFKIILIIFELGFCLLVWLIN